MNWKVRTRLKKLEVLLITVIAIIFSIIGEMLLNSVSFLGQFDRSLLDFDFTDLYYSNYFDSSEIQADENICLVNLGQLGRGEIAEQLNIINKYQPKAVGLNVFFFNDRDSVLDLKLTNALSKTNNLVMAGKPIYDSKGNLDSIATSHPMFTQNATIGINGLDLNSITGVSRSYSVLEKWDDKTYYNFSVMLARLYDPSSFEDLLSRNNQIEMINYKGNVISYDSPFNKKYYALNSEDILNENFNPDQIKGKIVLLSYLGDYHGDVYSLEDKFYSPLNKGVFEKSFPDMFAGVIHANIISNIIERDYIFHKTYLDWVFLFVIGFSLSFLLQSIYTKYKGTYHLASKIIAIVYFNLIIFFALTAFDVFRIKVEISYILLLALFVPDAAETVLTWFTKEKKLTE